MEENGPKSVVLFLNTVEVYQPKNEIVCSCSVSTQVIDSINETCWIGIFKVGWELITEYVSREFLVDVAGKQEVVHTSLSSSTDTTLEVRFHESVIPVANDTEFYQFCFVAGDGNVLGASCPFLITDSEGRTLPESLQSKKEVASSSTEDGGIREDLDWCPWLDASEDIDDAIILHSKTTLLEKALTKAMGENAELRKEILKRNIEMGNLNADLEDAVEKSSVQAMAMLACKKQKENDLKLIEELEEKFDASVKDKKALEDEIHSLKFIAKNLELQKTELKTDMDLLNRDFQIARDKELHKVCQGYEDRLQESAKAISDLGVELNNSKSYIANLKTRHKDEISNMSRSYDSIILQFDAQNSHYKDFELQKQAMENKLDEMSKSFMKEKRDFSDEIEALQTYAANKASEESAKINHLKKELSCSQKSLKKAQTVINDLEEALDKKGDELAEVKGCQYTSLHKQNVEFIESQMELRRVANELVAVKQENSLLKEKCNGNSGARHALQIAYKHTQRQLSSLKEDHETLSERYKCLSNEAKVDSIAETVKELHEQVEDLKLRLCIGANVYKKNVAHCKMMERELKRLTSRSSLSRAESPRNNSASAAESKQSGNDYVCSEGKESLKKLEAELEMKEETIKAMQRRIISLEQRFVEKTEALLLDTNPRKDLRDKNKETGFLQESKAGSPGGSAQQSIELLRAKKNFNKHLDCHSATPALAGSQERSCKIFYPPASHPLVSEKVFRNNQDRGKSSDQELLACGSQKIPQVEDPSSSNGVSNERQTYTKVGKPIPEEKCPVCGIAFPFGTTDVSAYNHVNSHFDDGEN